MPVRHRVAREQRHRARLRRGLRERARQPRLPELGLHGQPVPGLQLHRGRAVRGHLTDERHAERQHVVVGGGREHPAAAEDPALLAVQVAVARAGQARLELVGAPAEERQVHVAVDEPGNEQAAVGGADRGRPRQAACGSDVREDPVLPRHAGGLVQHARGRRRASGGERSRGRRERGGDRRPTCTHHAGSLAAVGSADLDPTVRPYTRCMHVEREIVLPTTPGQAWGVLVDWERQADWMLDADRVDVVSDHREGVGVRLAVKTRLFGVPAFTEPMEVTVWEPPRRLQIAHGSVVEGGGVWELDAVDGGTRFRWSEDIALRVPLVGELAARAYRPVMRMLMARAQRSLRAHVIAIGPVRSSRR